MINPDYPIKPLVIAVIEHAILEARKGDTSARRWLYSDGVLWLEGITDIHPEKIRAAIRWRLAGRSMPAVKRHRIDPADYRRQPAAHVF